MSGPAVSSLTVYPIKACRGINLPEALCTSSGLAWDREWVVIRSSTGRFVSQREIPKLALVSVQCPVENLTKRASDLAPDATLTVTAPEMPPLHVRMVPDLQSMEARDMQVWGWKGTGMDEGSEAAQWFSAFLGSDSFRLVRYIGTSRLPMASSAQLENINRVADPEFAGEGQQTSLADEFPILLASEAGLADLNNRLNAQGHPSIPMKRFRPNIVISGAPAWVEDQCRQVTVHARDQGPVELTSVKPCSRCKVPTINPDTAEVGDEPLETLGTFRKGSNLGWSVKSWKHSVFFGTNLVPSKEASGRILHLGDTVELQGKQREW